MYDIHRLLRCEMRGPGNFASGCHGESRYNAVERRADAVYTVVRRTEILKAFSKEYDERSRVIYRVE